MSIPIWLVAVVAGILIGIAVNMVLALAPHASVDKRGTIGHDIAPPVPEIGPTARAGGALWPQPSASRPGRGLLGFLTKEG